MPGEPDPPHPVSSATARSLSALHDALDRLESAVRFPDGVHGLATWLDEVSNAMTAVSPTGMDGTREEIAALIGRLLALNLQVHKLSRLKRLLR